MTRGVGRPPRPQSIEPELLEATHKALVRLGRELGVATAGYRNPDSGRMVSRARPLDLAVLALEAQEALEVLAAAEVRFARDHDGVTWEQVGGAFGISTQSAHHRFATKSVRAQAGAGGSTEGSTDEA